MKNNIETMNYSLSGAVCAGALLLTANGASAQNLFASTINTGNVYQYTSGGTQSTFASGLNYPYGIAFDAAGNLFVANSALNGPGGSISEITRSGTQSTFASNVDPIGLAFNNAGNLFQTDYFSGNIYEYTPNGHQSTFATLNYDALNGLEFNNAGNLFVGTGTGQIVEITPGGVQSVFAAGLNNVAGIAFQPVPEPSVMALGALGVVAFFARRRK
ncbi:MAG TPA: PEP-CTERM sorting domain-containing protein [Pseudomonadales bacterium]|nr:PEP-CTERM sorting domain-containing protein [Pseudomonadales bacterium]